MEQMVQALNLAGLHAIAAMPKTVAPRLTAPVVAVETAGASCTQAGMYRYLGMAEDGREMYGRRLEAVLRLEIFSPKAAAGDGVRKAVGQVMNVLLDGIPALSMGEITVEESSFNTACDCFTCAVRVPVSALVYATASDDGTEFTDFTLKGELK